VGVQEAELTLFLGDASCEILSDTEDDCRERGVRWRCDEWKDTNAESESERAGGVDKKKKKKRGGRGEEEGPAVGINRRMGRNMMNSLVSLSQ